MMKAYIHNYISLSIYIILLFIYVQNKLFSEFLKLFFKFIVWNWLIAKNILISPLFWGHSKWWEINESVPIYIYIYIYNMCMCMCLCVYICICVCKCMYICLCAYIDMYLYMCVYICACIYVYLSTYIHSDRQTYVYIHMYIYICIYLYVYIEWTD